MLLIYSCKIVRGFAHPIELHAPVIQKLIMHKMYQILQPSEQVQDVPDLCHFRPS